MRAFLGCFGLLLSQTALANSFQLVNLDAGDFAKVTDDLSASFMHTSVSGASPLGHIFGFEIGLVAANTATPNMNRLVSQNDPGASLGHLPSGELLGVVTVPFGLSVEVAGLPRIGASGIHANDFSLGVKWTFTNLLPVALPLDLAVKAQGTHAHVDARQTVNQVDTSYGYDGWVTALTVLASVDLLFVEPYAGVGIARGTGDMHADGAVVFAPEYASNNHGTATRGSTEFLLGAEAKFFVAKLGVEYARLFDTDRWAGKFSFYF